MFFGLLLVSFLGSSQTLFFSAMCFSYFVAMSSESVSPFFLRSSTLHTTNIGIFWFDELRDSMISLFLHNSENLGGFVSVPTLYRTCNTFFVLLDQDEGIVELCLIGSSATQLLGTDLCVIGQFLLYEHLLRSLYLIAHPLFYLFYGACW